MSDSIIPLKRAAIASTKSASTESSSKTSRSGGRLAHFMINKLSAVPLHVQLKEQIRYAIMSGQYQPGDSLPSIRELTAQLGIHRNTVHRVYLELQASSLLASKPGKGVFISENLTETLSVKELNAVDEMINRFFVEANTMGVNPSTLSRLMGQRAPGYDAKMPTVAFVECTAHQSQEGARDLGDIFGIHVHHLLLDDLREDPNGLPAHLQHLVTSIFHYDEVRDLVKQQKKVYPITYDLHSVTRRLLRHLEPETRLGFICHDGNTEEVIGKEIDGLVPEGVLVGCANLEAPDLALKLIGEADTVIFTEPAQKFCITNCTPEHELLELHFALNPASVEKVNRVVNLQP